MSSLMNLPLELRWVIYSHLLLDSNSSDTRTSIAATQEEEREYVRPKFCTSLFTVNKQISKESLQYFYGENNFIIARNCFKRTLELVKLLFPTITLKEAGLPMESALHRRTVLMISVAVECESPGFKSENVSEEKIVFAARHFALLVGILKTDGIWYQSPKDAIESICYNFTFNLSAGQFENARVLRMKHTFTHTLRSLTPFAMPQGLQEKIDYSIGGKIDQEQASELLHSLRLPISTTGLLEDFQSLAEEASRKAHEGWIHGSVRLLCHAIVPREMVWSRIRVLLNPESAIVKAMSLTSAITVENLGLYLYATNDFQAAAGHFDYAIRIHKSIGRPSVNMLASLCFFSGQALMQEGCKENDLGILQEAIEKFQEALRHKPHDSVIEAGLQVAQNVLDVMEGDTTEDDA